MAFDKKYPDPCKWSFILPFFGFERDKETNYRSRGVYVTDTNSLSGKSKMYRREAYQEDIYVRHTVPTGRARELEDKFMRLTSSYDKNQFAYITTSLKSFYVSAHSKKYKSPRLIFTIIAAILSGIWLLSYSYTFPFFKEQFGRDTGSVLFVFLVPGVLLLIGFLIDMLCGKMEDRRSKKIRQSYDRLTTSQKEAVRQQYFADMEKNYGKEAGAVLKEYAILKGYDRK